MRLIDMVGALKERGRDLEADYFSTVITTQLLLRQGFSTRRTLMMDLDEIEVWMKMPAKPAKYDGWNYWWGEAAFADLH